MSSLNLFVHILHVVVGVRVCVCVCVMMSKPRDEVRFWMEAELRVDVVWLV